MATQTSVPAIEFGNLEGRHFSPSAIDKVMVPLARLVQFEIPAAEGFKVWYDANEDFYHLSFSAHGKTADIKYYKGLSVSIDGEKGWCGCPMYREYAFVESIAVKMSGK